MAGSRNRVRRKVNRGYVRRSHKFENLEDRRMLSIAADIVFLVDNSDSDSHPNDTALTKEWLKRLATGDLNNNGTKDAGELTLSDRLAMQGIDDVRYGVVAYGEWYDGAVDRYAHSEVVDTDASKPALERLFSSGATADAHIADLKSAIEQLILAEYGGHEDGWDAIDHAISEYDFRVGAVPIFVLVQNGEGRVDVNKALTRDGILASLKSKNVILDTLVVGQNTPLFDLSPYKKDASDFANVRIFGVTSSESGNGQHDYVAFNTATNTVTTNLPATKSDALQLSYNGSNTGETGMVASGKSVLIGKKLNGGIGPSLAGYSAKSVAFESVPMTSGTTPPGANGVVAFPGGGFTFYGQTYTQFFANQDGTITFGSANGDGNNVDLSRSVVGQTRPGRMIAALWEDLSGGLIKTKAVDVDADGNLDLVIQWNSSYPASSSPDLGGITFQAVLYSNGNIQFNYVTVVRSDGVRATVGIWSGAPDPVTLPANKLVPGPHSIFGANQGIDLPSETNDSYVRTAWDTGGSVWDVGVVEMFGFDSDAANALRDSFVASLGNQINRAKTAGAVAKADDVLYAFDMGEFLTAREGFSLDPGLVSASIVPSNTQPIINTSNSVPLVGTPPAKAHDVFQTAATTNPGSTAFNLSFLPSQFPMLTDGRYIVELFFAEIGTETRLFDVKIEGKNVLNDYNIYNDHAKIVEVTGSPVTELDAIQAGSRVATVKRYAVDVSSADGTAGLQVDLLGLVVDMQNTRPLINAIRILHADAPRVENVVLKGLGWAAGVDYSYAEAVAAGNQHRPVCLQNANRIEVHFDGPVDVSMAQLKILGDQNATIKTTANPNATISFASYNATSHVATWNLTTPLTAGKYSLELSGVKGAANLGMDGHWTNFDGPDAATHSPDGFSNDKKVQLLSGNGGQGTEFKFHFAVLPGDYNQDGIVTSADAAPGTVKDGNGNGVVENGPSGADTLLATSYYANTQLAFRTNGGDYSDNDIVNTLDYQIWKETYGSQQDLRADGNGNGVIDVGDYVLWRIAVGGYSAWSNMPMGFATTLPVVDFGNAPRISNVIVSGSNSVHAAYSFDSHDGSGEQLKTVPVGGADTISIVFSEDVNVVAENLYLVGLGTFNIPAVAEFAYDMTTMTATWRFNGLIGNDQYLLSLSDDVTDVEGNRLDGEWRNPMSITTVNSQVSQFPSGNGAAGGRFNFVLTLLAGDANPDAMVGAGDLSLLLTNYGVLSGMLFTNADFNGDGKVTSADLSMLLANYGANYSSLRMFADLDGDFDVDATDLNTFMSRWGMANPTQADGDFNGDGAINELDCDLFFHQYGLALNIVS